MDPYNHNTPSSTKLPILDTGKFEQWKFIIHQYLQPEHYALWEVIEFGDSYKPPLEEPGKAILGEGPVKKKGRTLTVTAKDMQKIKNDVKARTTLLLALPDEHHLRFSKYESAKELLQAIVSHLEFLDVPIEQEDLNQKFLTSLAPEWLMYTIVWRYRDDLDTMSLDDLYNHLKVYEPKVQKKARTNTQDMAFISSSNISSGKSEVPTASVPTASSQVSTASTEFIDEDDIEEMDIKWNLALLSMRADRLWKKTGKKIVIQGSDVVGFDKSKVKCYNCHKMGHFARKCRAPRSQDRGKRESYMKDPKVDEPAPKALMALDGIGAIWPMKKKTMQLKQMIGLSPVEARLVEFKQNELKFYEKIRLLDRDIELKDNKIENLKNELEEVSKEKGSIASKLEKIRKSAKDLDDLLGNQRSVKDKTGMGFNEYTAVPPPPAQVYLPPQKDLSWTGLPEFVDDTVTDYTRSTPSVDVSNCVRSEQGESSSNIIGKVVSKPWIKFAKGTNCPSVIKFNNTKNARKPIVNISQSSNVMPNNSSAPIIKDWDSETESEVDYTLNTTVKPSIEQAKCDKPTRKVIGMKETPKQNHSRGNQRNWNN
ncbi:putative ribonuclease H-like domain-containing protein [Tanacetum coccineum]